MPTFTLAQRNADLDRHNAQTLIRIAQETGDTPLNRTFGTPPGDERKLRGIPAIGRGVAGAIPGSSPHAIR
jgi:hypothetical protein